MAAKKLIPFSEQLPGSALPKEYIVLDLILTLKTTIVEVKDDDHDLSPQQRRILAELNKKDDDEEPEEKVTVEKKVTPARFLGNLIEGYYGVTDYSVVLFNGDAFNVMNSPNEIDSKITEYNERFTSEEG